MTRCNSHESFVLCLHRVGPGFPVTPLYIFDQPFKGHVVDALAPLSFVIYLDFLSIRSIDQNVMDLFRILFKRSIQIKLVFLAKSAQNGICKTGWIHTGLPSKRCDRSLIDTQRFIRDHQILVKLHLIS